MTTELLLLIVGAALVWHALIIAFVWWYKPRERQQARPSSPEERILDTDTFNEEFADD